jgi:hypothetical protein
LLTHFVRQALALAFAGALLASCAANSSSSVVPGANSVSMTNPSSVLQSLTRANPDSSPIIKSVSPIQATQYQNITIKGKGFGTMAPYNGDSCCIQFVVHNSYCYPYGSTWQAGYEATGNEVTLSVTKWGNKKIVVSGFTGYYGYSCWYLQSGQGITLNIWSAKTGKGPATWSGTVQ